MIQARTADEIISKHNAARGGIERLNTIQTLRMEGTREIMEEAIAVTANRVQGKLSRMDFMMLGEKGYTLVTPFEGWIFIPQHSQMPQRIVGERLSLMQEELDIQGPFVDYIEKGNKITKEGKEQINGSDAYKIKLTLPSGKSIIHFIDCQNYLLVQTRHINKEIMGKNLPASANEVITDFSDYKSIEGIQFPHRISNPGNGSIKGVTTFSRIELNKPVSEHLFSR